MWLEWPGWSFIGNMAQVVSLVAIVFAAYELIARARRVSWVNWGLSPFAWADHSGGRFRTARVDLVNLGQDDVLVDWIYFVGCEHVPEEANHFSFG